MENLDFGILCKKKLSLFLKVKVYLKSIQKAFLHDKEKNYHYSYINNLINSIIFQSISVVISVKYYRKKLKDNINIKGFTLI